MGGVSEHSLRRRGLKAVNLIGKGSFGLVKRVTRLSDGKAYALKETPLERLSQSERQDAAGEVRIMASFVTHPCILRFHEAFLEGSTLCVVTELCAHSDLSALVRKKLRNRSRIEEEFIWSAMLQAALALDALHSHGILHRDVKLANLMLSTPWHVKLGDLGVSKVLKQRQSLASTQIGTPASWPPELWRGHPYSFVFDSFGLGCCIFELCSLQSPFRARNMTELKLEVVKNNVAELPECAASTELAAVVHSLLAHDARKRLSASALLQSSVAQARMQYLPAAVRDACMDAPNSVQPSEHVHGAMPEVPHHIPESIMQTIRVPRANMRQLLGQRLPPASYPEEDQGAAAPSETSITPRAAAHEARQAETPNEPTTTPAYASAVPPSSIAGDADENYNPAMPGEKGHAARAVKAGRRAMERNDAMPCKLKQEHLNLPLGMRSQASPRPPFAVLEANKC